MHVPVSVSTFTAISALLVVSLATLIDASDDQNSIFSEAQAYEHFMGRWSRKLAPLFVRFAGVRDADTVLDVGSGTGALTAAVAKVAPSSRIVGIDPSASVRRACAVAARQQACPLRGRRRAADALRRRDVRPHVIAPRRQFHPRHT